MELKKLLCLMSILFFTVIGISLGQESGCKPQKTNLSKASYSLNYTKLNINNVSTYFYNNGDTDINPNGNSGFEFPKGTDKTAIFESGLVWGAVIDGAIKVGGSTYNQGLQPGRILEDGTAEDPAQAYIYRVRKDYANNADFRAEIEDGEGTEEEIYAKYENDWNNWPAEYGAPYEDVDGDGTYNPSVDIPGVPGADQTVWYVANDLDESLTKNLYGSKPMGIEMQATFWAYNSAGPLGNTTFRKYKLINKSDTSFDSMFVSYWADSDVGAASNDYAGCDTTLNFMFAFNGTDYDDMYGETTPAVGYALLQGPIVEGTANDVAIFNGKVLQDYKNLEMTGHYHFLCGIDPYIDPQLGTGGAEQFYNLFNGKFARSGEQVIDIVTNEPTMFTLTGNPVTQTGWYYTLDTYCGDVRNGMFSGSFNMAVGDTQEVVFAVIAAMGDNRLNSFSLLKSYIKIIEDEYTSGSEPIIVKDIPKPEVELEEILNTDNIELTISYPDELTSYNEDGFSFQGVNVYQFSSDLELTEAGKKIATFDIADGVTDIVGIIPNYTTGEVETGVQQSGTDSGLEDVLSISTDAFTGEPFIKGKRYYFGVAAYIFNPDNEAGNNNFESKISMVAVDFHATLSGANYGDLVEISNQDINEDVNVNVFIADPNQLTGHDYEVSFSSIDYYLDTDGEWKPVSSKAVAKDVSGSSLSGIAVTAESGIDLTFTFNLVSPNDAWVDGIVITLPNGITINSAEICDSYGGYVDPDIDGQTVTWGDNSLSANGTFMGGEELTININATDLPIQATYIIYDDGYDADNGGVVNAEGTVVIDEIIYATKTEQGWNLTDATTGEALLELQGLVNSRSPRIEDEEIIDGMQIQVSGSFDAPNTFSSFEVNNDGNRISSYGSTDNYQISDYYAHGWSSTARAIDVFGMGTTDIEKLKKDYEFRWTGEYEEADANGVVYVKEGTGSIATIYSTRNYTLSQHPMYPYTSGDEPFTVRIPFEVWNIDDNQQVNLIMIDRSQDVNANPFYAFNPNDRMYLYIIDSPYAESVINPYSDAGAAICEEYATWNLVFWKATGNVGDIIRLRYADPILLTDVFEFNTNNVIASEKTEQVIDTYELGQNYPNPFNPVTTIRYTIPEAGYVKLKVYDILGREVVSLVNKEQVQGTYQVQFNAAKFSSGVYIYRIESGNFSATKKMMLLK